MIAASAWTLVLSAAENFVLINAVMSLTAFGVAAAAVVTPPLLSAWLVAASLLPATWFAMDRWAQEHRTLHSRHLLNSVTEPLDPVLGYAALAFVLLAAGVCFCAAVKGYFRVGSIIRRLEIGAEPASVDRVDLVQGLCGRYGVDVGLVVSSYPFSFVWGSLRSKLIISTGLLNALTVEELRALLEHEAAHHVRRDNLSRWILTACRYSSLVFPLTGLLYRWWSEQVEMVCDEVAAQRTSAPVEVAGALVRLKRLSLVRLPRERALFQSSFQGERSDSFDRRVTRVLSLPERPNESEILSRSWVRAVAAVSAVFMMTLATVFIVSPLAIHRVLEIVMRSI
jgi:Zn-dependent protease with chaperone function